jgi:hypothetical protein
MMLFRLFHARINLLCLYTLFYQIPGRPAELCALWGTSFDTPCPIITISARLTARRQNPVSVVKYRVAPIRCADECQRFLKKKYRTLKIR